MNRNRILLFLLVNLFSIIIVSCNDNKETKKTVGVEKDSIQVVKDRIIIDSVITYYPNTMVLKSVEYFVNDTLEGVMRLYDSLGRIEELREYIRVRGSDYYLNSWKRFDSLGNVDTINSHFFTIINPFDTLDVNEEFCVRIRLTAPYFNSRMRVLHGSMTNDFFIPDNSKIEFLECDKFIACIPVNTDIVGDNLLKFIIQDYRMVQDSVLVDEVKSVMVKIPYFVR